jgi:PKD repeat protein
MGSMVRGASTAVVMTILFLLLPAGAGAQSGGYDFSVSPNPPNEDQTTTFRLLPASATGIDDVDWDLNGNGGFESSGRTVTRVYTEPGSVRVRMRVDEDDGDRRTVTKTIVVNGRPAVDFGFAPAAPLAGQAVSFTPAATDPEGDSVAFGWQFGDGASGVGAAPSHAYGAAGTYSVLLTATDEHGAVTTRQRTVTVAADPGPSPGFDYSPAAPLTGDLVTFTSTSTPSQGSIADTRWDLDGDGAFDDAAGTEVTWTFATAGDHMVLMRVTQSNGKSAISFTTVTVGERPPPPGEPVEPAPGGTGEPSLPVLPGPTARRPLLMRPFPVVRIAGVVLPRGALIRILSVRVPRGAQVRVRCRGKGCPTGSVARTSATRLVRFRRFERRLPAGVRIELFVRQPGKIGKYTRFRIRGGKPPARMDRCLMPGKRRPVSCP